MKLIAEFTQFDCPVKLEQSASGTFRVTYGAQVKDRLSYGAACRELGECLMHSMTCAGLIDDTEE